MLQVNFQPFPIIDTKRLVLRQPLLSDAANVFEMRSDPEVMRYIPRQLAETEHDAEELISMINDFAARNEKINWGIEWKETGQLVGMIGFVNIKPEHYRAEVGYSLVRKSHRQGIMSEALQATLDFGFEQLKLHSIEAIVDAENVASARLLQNAGFRQEAFFKEDFLWNGRFRNSVHYGMLKVDYERASR